MPPDVERIEQLLKLIFGDQVPSWALPLVGGILLLALASSAVLGGLTALSKITKVWTEDLRPRFYNPEAKRRSERRRRFADHLESEIRRLNNLEEWRDYRFTELEAEVEAEGRRRAFGTLPFLQRTRSGLRRERSLSKALESSQERLILLEGEPGSGKSVALRYVAQSMARRAMRARSISSVIPIYINLKELQRRPEEAIDRKLIYSFILKTLNRVNDRDIEEFLEQEFDRGLQEGTWLFLFDSFDELPEVLSSIEADTMIRHYADAILDFLHGMNLCRGVVASRQFRGPGQLGWPRFRILPLAEARRHELIHKADLKSELETELLGQLGIASFEVRGMASNPMFLGLICEHMRSGYAFPENVHSVFETYIGTRLTRDAERLQRRFKLEPGAVRAAAESIAFMMAANPGLGLNPSRQSLGKAMAHLGYHVNGNFNTLLDALEYIKLARSETSTPVGDSKPFTFAHRRFQEYFATCVVLREPERVTPLRLLTDARWRETAVVMCQTQPADVLSHITEEARRLLADIVAGLPGLIENPLQYVHESESPNQDKEVKTAQRLPKSYTWPYGVLHILGILQDGFGRRLKELPNCQPPLHP
ncbi:MAG TPA: NACHT domain-containing protein [Anaerolineae bacterium]|nr:NACHT domain-containing protein [Anaerolineae bacterium]